MLFGGPLTPPVIAFIDAFASIPAEELQSAVRRSTKAQAATGMSASKKTKLSEARTQVLREAILERLRPRAEDFERTSTGLLSVVASGASIVSRVLLQPKKLDDAEFEAVVGPYREAGIAVPTRAELSGRSSAMRTLLDE